MKRNKLIVVLAGAIVLTGLGSAGFAMAQTLNSMKQSLSSSNKAEFKMDEITPAQEAQIQAADAKLQAELTQEFQVNPVGTFARFAAFAMLPAAITERIASDLLGQSVVANLRSVDQILTPQQRQIWQQRFSNLNQG